MGDTQLRWLADYPSFIVRLSFVIRSFGLNLGLAESVRMDYCAEERERWCVFDLNMVIGTFVNLLIICTFAEN